MADYFEFELLEKSHRFLAATDEVGRGPLAGPVVGCSVYVNTEGLRESLKFLKSLGITDSKKISMQKRERILTQLGFNCARIKKSGVVSLGKTLVSYRIEEIKPSEIDDINILNASLKSMRKGLVKLCNKGESGLVLIDGNKAPAKLSKTWQVETVIKGDSKSLLIGLASILAKVYRDRLMERLDKKYSGYGFAKHSGYPTKAHKEAIQLLGPCEAHRKTFAGVKEFV